jgi:gluconate 2-dehydrogenase subunit 3-like protein
MAFDNKTARGDAGAALRLSRELGRTYLGPSAAPPRFRMLEPERQATLSAWADALIPGGEGWPAAAEVGAAAYVDNCAALSPVLRGALRAALTAVESGAERRAATFAELDPATRREVLTSLEAERPELFTLVLELTFEGYYRHPRVQRAVEERTGFRPDVPVVGMPLDPFDEATLARVRSLPPRVRRAGEPA